MSKFKKSKKAFGTAGFCLSIAALLLALSLIFCITACGHQNKELSDECLVKIVAENLGVPDSVNAEFEVGQTFYWEAGGCDFKTVTFTKNGEVIACASVDPYTGKLLKNIYKYEISN